MELPVQSPDSGYRKTRYIIKTNNISYAVSPRLSWTLRKKVNPTSIKHILKEVNCEVKPGEMTAIAGPSGAGKTTLLEILAGVIPPCRVSGHIMVNNGPMNPAVFRRVSGYVTQEDLLFPLLTVEETLMYSARLRLHGGIDDAKARVRELLMELGLRHVAGERIGAGGHGGGRGISGGEKRRVSIGVDLVHDPAVLLMDEPTSGLDSAAALQVMLLLKSMAETHRKTVVFTIHQPGFRIIELFDHVLLLFDGMIVHHGPLHVLEERLKLSGHGIPRQVNLLEFSIDLIETLITNQESNIINTPIDVIESKNQYELYEYNLKYANSPLMEVFILSQRFSYNIFRTKQLFVAKMVQAVLVGILLGTIFMNFKRFQMQTQIGFFAFNLTFLLYSSSEALPIFLNERRIFTREVSNGAYRVSSYSIANAVVFIPFLLIVSLLYTIPIYWLVGLRSDFESFLYFSLVVWLVLLMSNSFVAFFSAVVPNFIMGISLIAGLMGSFFLFSGYFISNSDIPKYWIFMHYLSLFRYPFECFMLNEFGGERGRWRCIERIEDVCLVYGEGFLKKQSLKETQKWSHLVVMIGFVFGYRFLSLLVLSYRSFRNGS